MENKDGKMWAWCHDGYPENMNGPYETREDAIKDATESCESYPLPSKVQLGLVNWIHAREYIQIDVNDLLDSLDGKAIDDYGGFYTMPSEDEPFFDVKKDDQQRAQEDLCDLLKKWAEKWILENGWTMEVIETLEIKGYMNENKSLC